MSDVAPLRRALLAWYDRARRDLPWRRTQDPYAIWISEAMLQQTRVETVIPYWERFLARFPDVGSLAGADLDDVLGVWQGLGYYSRARNLHRAAGVVMEEHGGRLPDDAEGLRSLPGVGRYTAGAVASIAFDRPEPVLDGNVARVLARLLEIREDVKRTAVATRLWEMAAHLVDGPRPGDLNQALMELGATLCTPRSPRCGACPVSARCAARASGDPEAIPARSPKRPVPRIHAACALVARRGRLLAVRRPPEGLMGGLWELPGGDLEAAETRRPARALSRLLGERVGLRVAGLRKRGQVEHVFTHRRLLLHVYRAAEVEGRVRLRGPDGHRWVSREGLAQLPQSVLMRKALEVAL